MTILAKSTNSGRPPVTLASHTGDVLDAAQALFGTPAVLTRLGRQWLRFFKVPDECHFPALLRISCAFHDWGKANAAFQGALRSGAEQTVWHEHLSAVLLGSAAVESWLKKADPHLDYEVLLAAVLSHHLRATSDSLGGRLTTAASLHVLARHPGWDEWLAVVCKRCGLPEPDFHVPEFWWMNPDCPQSAVSYGDAIQSLRRRLDKFYKELRSAPSRAAMLRAARAALICADAAGSGLVREGADLSKWLAAAFDEAALMNGEAIRAKVIAPRLRHLLHAGRWRPDNGRGGWTEFQDDAADLPARALLLAPCGAGKTLAAWRWIESQAAQRPVQRVIFLYPTRATATEGFRDYVSWAPESDAALVHGTAGFDLEGMFSNPADERTGKDFTAESRLFALSHWPRRIFSATVDQFLAFLQNHYASICLLPLLADSILVVDEVHAFDRGMFSAFLKFLQNFDLPVLAMTATLQQARREALEQDAGLYCYSEKKCELAQYAGARRYHIRQTTEEGARETVAQALRDGRRVLWVVNQVPRAQDIGRSFAASPESSDVQTADGVPVFCYHSRFTLEHRREWHQQVVQAFQLDESGQPQGAVFAVTTQVCEMSLDLDADLLVTESAPVTALIQRMGRCNRKNPPRDRPGEVLIYAPENERPYAPEWLQGVPEFVAHLAAVSAERGGVSQADLEDAMLEFSALHAEPPKMARFLECGPWAQAGEESFRDTDEFTRQAVLSSDEAAWLDCQRRRDSAGQAYILPVPQYVPVLPQPPGFPAWLSLVDAAPYHPAFGYCTPKPSR